MDSRTQVAPENHGQLISRSLILYRLTFSRTWIYALLLSITVFIPRLVSNVIGQDIWVGQSILSLHRLWLIVIAMFALIFFISIVWNMHCYIRNKHEPMLEDFRMGSKKVLSVLLAGILLSALILGFAYISSGILVLFAYFHLLFHSSLLIVFLTIGLFFLQFFLLAYISTLFIFVIPLITIENKGLFKGIETSVFLVWNHWWRVFSTQIIPWIFFLIALVVIRSVMNLDVHIYFTEKHTHDMTSTILNLGCFALFVPWVAALLISQLKDLEIRKQLGKSPKTES